MTEAISGDGAAVAPGGGFEDDDDNDSHYSRDSHSLDTMDEAPNLTNNVRIKSKRFLRDYEVEDDVGTLNAGWTLLYIGFILTKHMCYNSGDNLEASADLVQITSNAAAINLESAPGGANAAGALSSGGVGGGNNGATASNGGNQAGDDAKVPSRVTVKKLSSQVSLEAKRKEEMEVRRKKLMDRMANKGEKAGEGEKQDDARIGLTAKLKAQKASGDRLVESSKFSHFLVQINPTFFFFRLSIGHKPPTLPDGVTMRDDPMTKTIAFLNAQPKLT
jgi:hypothetical protein